MKKLFIVLIVFLVSQFALTAFAADTKLGMIDMQKILTLSDAGKDAKEQLSLKGAKYEAEKNLKEDDIKKLRGELERQSVLLSESARVAKEKDYQQKLKELQRFLKDAQEDLQAKETELISKILDEFNKLVQEFGKKNDYAIIYVRDERMIFTDDKIDLTDELLKQFNAARKSVKK